TALWFAPKPRRSEAAISRTSGWRAARASTEPSSEALSRTAISYECRLGGCRLTESTAATTRSRVQWLTTDTTTSGCFGPPAAPSTRRSVLLAGLFFDLAEGRIGHVRFGQYGAPMRAI